MRQYIVGGHRRWSYICAFWVAHLHYVYVLSCRFVGALFAMSLRSKFTLPLDLAVTVWKQVLDEPLTDDDLDRSVAICVDFQGWLSSLLCTTPAPWREI